MAVHSLVGSDDVARDRCGLPCPQKTPNKAFLRQRTRGEYFGFLQPHGGRMVRNMV